MSIPTNHQTPINLNSPRLQREMIHAVNRTVCWLNLQNDREVTIQQLDKTLNVHTQALRASRASQQQLSDTIQEMTSDPFPPLESLQGVQVQVTNDLPTPQRAFPTPLELELVQEVNNRQQHSLAEQHTTYMHQVNQDLATHSQSLDARLADRQQAAFNLWPTPTPPAPEPSPRNPVSNLFATSLWFLRLLLRHLGNPTIPSRFR